MPQPVNFQEFPKMVFHKTKAPRTVKDANEESTLKSQGYSTQAPSQFEEENTGTDPTAEPAIVSELEQQKTRLAGNMGAKDPAQLLADEENGDENSEDEEAPAAPAPKKKAGK